MPPCSDVRPQKWTKVIDLYDDGGYSVIWGHYNGDDNRCPGVRWNGEDNTPGFPSQGGHSVWFVEPEFLTKTNITFNT